MIARRKGTDSAGSEAACFMLAREQHSLPVVSEFTVKGEPKSKARARIGPNGAYTPETTKTGEEKVAWAFRQATRGHEPDAETRYGVFVIFFCATRQRRDVDNMAKLVLDGLTGIAWDDDVQVAELACRKTVCDKGHERTEILIYEIPGAAPIHRMKRCPVCGLAFRVFDSTESKTFCSPQCHGINRRREKTCKECGDVYHGRDKSPFCSKACGQAHRRQEVPCSVCGEIVNALRSQVTKKHRIFCGPECRRVYWRPIQAQNAKGVCSDCGKPTSKKKYKRCAHCSSGAFK